METINILAERFQQGFAMLNPVDSMKALAVPAVLAAIHPLAGVMGLVVIIIGMVLYSRAVTKEQETNHE
jgi:hypothetical protein